MKRSPKNVTSKRKDKPNPIVKKEDIQDNPDNKIDDDFSGYPHGPSQDEAINPKTKKDKVIANVNIKDGEKINSHANNTDEQQSDASGNAFEGTEKVKE